MKSQVILNGKQGTARAGQGVAPGARGIALAAVMLLLLVITLIGVLSLRMAKEQQTMSANLKDLTKAQFAAEEAVRTAIDLPITSVDNDPDNINWSYGPITGPSPSAPDYSFEYTIAHKLALGNATVLKDGEGFSYYVINAEGKSGNARRKIEVAVVDLTKTERYVTDAFIGCRGVDFKSNSVVDSYSSSASQDPDLGNMNENGDVRTLESVGSYDGDVVFDSNATVRGDLTAYGSVEIKDSDITGNLIANGNLTRSGSGEIGEKATTGGSIQSPSNSWIGNGWDQNVNPNPVEDEPCDALVSDDLPNGVEDLVDDEGAIIAAAANNGEYGGAGAAGNSYSASSGTDNWGTDGESKNFHFDDFTLDSTARVNIYGDVKFYIEGDFTMLSNTTLYLDPNANLTIYLEGEWLQDSNARVNSLGDKVNPDPGIPSRMLVYASVETTQGEYQPYDQASAKVEFNSDALFSGVMYAPNAHVMYNSNAHGYGAIRGRWSQMDSNGSFHFDEDLAEQQEFTNVIPLGYKIVYWTEDAYESYSVVAVTTTAATTSSATTTAATTTLASTTEATTTTTTTTTAAATTTTTVYNPPLNDTDRFICKSGNNKAILEVSNDSGQDCTIQALSISWPSPNGELRLVELESEDIYKPDLPCCDATITEFEAGADRTIENGTEQDIKFKFQNDPVDGDYAITVVASCGTTVIERSDCEIR